jgi:hypothetical protein
LKLKDIRAIEEKRGMNPVDIVSIVSEIAANEWRESGDGESFSLVPQPARRRLFHDLRDIRTLYSGFSGYYITRQNNIVSHISFKISTLLSRGIITVDMIDYLDIDHNHWITLIQTYFFPILMAQIR